jgi:hypothetical protein
MRLVTFFLLQLVLHVQTASGQSGCIPPDSNALYFRRYVRAFVTRTDPDGVTLRARSIFRITDSTKVVLVTSATTCTKVVTGFNANRGTPGMPRRLYVVDVNKLGYFIHEPLPPPTTPNTSPDIAFSMTKTFVVSTIFQW